MTKERLAELPTIAQLAAWLDEWMALEEWGTPSEEFLPKGDWSTRFATWLRARLAGKMETEK